MTTVVYSNGVLAADRRITQGGEIVGDTYKKVFRTQDGWIGAWCGTVTDGYAFAEWAINTTREDMPPRGDYVGILINPKGKVFEFEHGKPLPATRRRKFYTLGSGGTAALGALYAGASVKKAVQVAQKIDSASGGGVDVIELYK